MKKTTIYAKHLENTALEQFEDAMAQGFVVSGALMPDAHTGYSLPIGAVVATKDVIVPAWVGYDIGCGMCALKLENVDSKLIKENSKSIFDLIYKKIPVGFNANEWVTEYSSYGLTSQGRRIAVSKKYQLALCSLGGGNHFIEIGEDENSQVWIIIHSGSRGVGHGIATYYMTKASVDPERLSIEFDLSNENLKNYNPDKYESYKEKYIETKTKKSKPKEGHFGFDVNSQNGKDYIQDLNWCLDFALENRKEMVSRVIEAITESLEMNYFKPNFEGLINRNHNHATEKDGLWIHRKGATHAESGMMGVIPGNMRDGSFIVKGKGNPDSLYSSSHGAGRVMGRKQADRELKTSDFISTMKGITAKVDSDTLDESPMAYKNIFEVMDLQKDLVEVLHHVRPIINIKG